MKLIQQKNEEDLEQSVSHIEREGDETVLGCGSFATAVTRFGTLYIPEGIEKISEGAFCDVWFHTFHFPKSLKVLGRRLFRTAFDAKIVYAGSSADLIQLAMPEKVEKYESDGFDHYPYYSGNSAWVTYYYAFDEQTGNIEVECEEDGVTLLYGTRNRRDDDPPKIK